MKPPKKVGLIGLVLATATLIAPGCLNNAPESVPAPEDTRLSAVGEVLDIEALPAGTILSATLLGSKGSGPIQVTGRNPGLPEQNAAVVFDSANPTGGDVDLGTPHEDFGGPGQGAGGASSSAYPNNTPLGKLIIVDASLLDEGGDDLVDDPNDADVDGAAIEFNFSGVGTVTAHEITIVDVEPVKESAFVDLFGPGETLLDTIELPQVGDNGVATVSLGPTEGVRLIRVTFNGSGAIDNIAFVAEAEGDSTGSIGDFVWCDSDEDGEQDDEEPGIGGVTIKLFECSDCDPDPIATTTTDEDGHYLFDGLEAGCYRVVAKTPEDREPGECPREITVELEEGQDFLDADFCFEVEEDEADEGCSHGFWKNHHDAWVDYEPDQKVVDVFASASIYDGICDATLQEALKFHGGHGKSGAAQILLRDAVAALLNASSPDVDYPRSAESVISDVDEALLSEDRHTMLELKDALGDDNNKDCPLDGDDDDDDDDDDDHGDDD